MVYEVYVIIYLLSQVSTKPSIKRVGLLSTATQKEMWTVSQVNSAKKADAIAKKAAGGTRKKTESHMYELTLSMIDRYT